MYPPPDSLPPPLVVESTESGAHELVVRVCGELDLLTHGVLRKGLDALPLDGIEVVRLHLAELVFCDSHGLRQLLTFVRTGRMAGQDVRIEEPSPILLKLMSLFAPWALLPQAVPDDLAS